MKTGSKLAIIIFVIVAAAHLYRVVFAVSVTVDGWLVPQWPSVLAVVITVFTAWMLWKESK